MKTLYLERSVGECRKGDWAEGLDLDGVGRIVVGMGPGSFAGVRAALAFAQGYALGRPGVEVLGLPSPCAVAGGFFAAAPADGRLTVVGDARQGRLWIADFEGCRLLDGIRQIDRSELRPSGPESVVSPDDRRIGGLLRDTFGDRYLGERLPTSEGLRIFAEANPAALVREPLPLYLNPAVRS